MISLKNVTVVYPDKTKAIDAISFSMAKNDNIALIGANGAGKTSLFLAIMGILDLTNGVIEVDGLLLNTKTVHEIRKKAGLIFQNPDDQLFMPLIYDDIAFGCRNFGMNEEEINVHVTETLEKLHIGHLKNRSSLRLSGGEKRIAAIATVLAMNPSVLLFDEPSAFLDPKARRSLIETVKKMPQPKIIASHDLTLAAEICNRVVLLKNGCIAADGTIDILYDKTIMRENDLEEIRKV